MGCLRLFVFVRGAPTLAREGLRHRHLDDVGCDRATRIHIGDGDVVCLTLYQAGDVTLAVRMHGTTDRN